jgi:hypothetical protein
LTRLGQLADTTADEVLRRDIQVLDTLDILHELVAGGVSPGELGAIRSFPVPRPRLVVDEVPHYILIAPPFVLGEIAEFDPTVIQDNIDLGRLVGWLAFADLREERKRQVLTDWLSERVRRNTDEHNEAYDDYERRRDEYFAVAREEGFVEGEGEDARIVIGAEELSREMYTAQQNYHRALERLTRAQWMLDNYLNALDRYRSSPVPISRTSCEHPLQCFEHWYERPFIEAFLEDLE